MRGLLTDVSWRALDRTTTVEPPDLTLDYAGRVIALLVERLGGQITLEAAELDSVANRLMLLPRVDEPRTEGQPTIHMEVRRLAGPDDAPRR